MVNQLTREYELVAILSPEATQDEVSASVERLEKSILDRGGSVRLKEVWGLRRLAFPVKKFSDGNFVLLRFSLVAGALLDFDRSLNMSGEILRSLITKARPDAKTDAPAATEATPESGADAKTDAPAVTEATPESGADAETDAPAVTEATPESGADAETKTTAKTKTRSKTKANDETDIGKAS